MFEKYGDLMTMEDVGEALGVHVVTARRIARAGGVPAVRIGRRLYVPKTRLAEMFKEKEAHDEQ